MTAFVIASAVVILLALVYIARPLWRATPLPGIAVIVTLALLTAVTYTLIGTPAALDPANLRAPDTLPEAIVQLEAELERDPTQPEGWRLLARAYTAAGRATEARDAFARAVVLAPDDADLLAEAAEARALAAPERRFDAEGVALLERALELQPMNQRARWFLGIAQRQAQQHAQAAASWEPLLAIVDADTARSLREQIDDARKDAGLEPLPAAVAARPEPADPGITVSISLDPQLAMRLPADGVVFVIARSPGSRMPAAVRKLPAGALPTVITLDDGDSPMPTLKLSELDVIVISARISASGDATPRKGDFEAAPATVQSGQRAAAVMIDRVVE